MSLIERILRYFPCTSKENADVNDLVDAELFDEFASLLDRNAYIDIVALVVRICSKYSVKRLRMLRYVVDNYYIPHNTIICFLIIELNVRENREYYNVLVGDK